MPRTHLDVLLIVEDELDHANLIMEVLQEEGRLANEIIHVQDGQQGIDYIYKKGEYEDRNVPTPGLVLLDLKLPDLDGFEVLKIIKQDETYKEIPIVMLTTSRNTEDVKKALQLGANDYIVKPVAWEEFERKVRKLGKYWALVSDTSLAKQQY